MRIPARTLRAPLLSAILMALPVFVCACRSGSLDEESERALSMHREYALRYYDAGDLDRSEQQADKGLELAPKDRTLRLMKGWIRQRRGKARDIFVAEAIFRDLAKEGDYRATLGLAEALERKGVLYDEAASAVERGERVPEVGDRASRAADLRRLARASWTESVTSYHQTLDAKPEEQQAINGLQRVHALLGEYEASLGWSAKLLEQTATAMEFWRGQLQRPELTAREEARLRKLLSANKRLAVETHLSASTFLVRLGRPAEALEHLDRTLDLDPGSAQAWGRRAQVLRNLGLYAEAVDSAQEFLRRSELEYGHPDVRRAYELMEECELEIRSAAPAATPASAAAPTRRR